MTETNTQALFRAGEGEPMVLLHGFKATWHNWRPLVGELTERYEIIAPTLPGHFGGPEFHRTGALQLSDASDALEEQLDGLGVGDAHMVGNSLGGALALEMAKRGRARSVVAIAPAGGWDPATGESRRLARFFVRQRALVRAGRGSLPLIMRGKGSRRLALRDIMWRGERMTAPDAIDLVRWSERCAIEGRVIAALKANRATIDGLDQVRVPTLIAWPERDRILPLRRHAQRFRDEISGVEYIELPGAGHVPMWDTPQLVTDTIEGFVSRHVAGARASAPAHVTGP